MHRPHRITRKTAYATFEITVIKFYSYKIFISSNLTLKRSPIFNRLSATYYSRFYYSEIKKSFVCKILICDLTCGKTKFDFETRISKIYISSPLLATYQFRSFDCR